MARHFTARGAQVHLFLPGQKKSFALADFKLTYFPPPPSALHLESKARELAQQADYTGFTPEELVFHLRFEAYRNHAPFLAALQEAIAETDAVILEAPFWARAVSPLCRQKGRPLFLTVPSALFQLHPTNSRSRKLLLVHEIESLRLADAVFFTSAADRPLFAKYQITGEIISREAGPPTNDAPFFFAPYETALNRCAGKTLAPVQPRGLILIDSSLKTIHGHHFNYAKAIATAAHNAGVPFLILAAQKMAEEVTAAFGAAAIPTFQYDVFTSFTHPEKETPPTALPLYDFTIANIDFHNEMVRAFSHLYLHDVLFTANADHRQLLGWSWLIAALPPLLCPEIVIMLRFSYYRATGRPENDGVGLDGRYTFVLHGLQSIDHANQGHRIRLVTDSHGLAREYQPWTNLPIQVVPIPHTVPPQTDRDSAFLPLKKAGRIRFITLGDARGEKGGPILTKALRILAQRPDFGDMEFVIQAYFNSHHPEILPFLDELRHLAETKAHFTFIERPLSEAEYYAHLTRADVVLIPYLRTSYGARTSGIFTEAIANGKPVVVTDRTWMSGQLGDSGAGVVFSDDDPQNLAEAILTAQRDYAMLREKTLRLRESYFAYHNPDSFLHALMHAPQ